MLLIPGKEMSRGGGVSEGNDLEEGAGKCHAGGLLLGEEAKCIVLEVAIEVKLMAPNLMLVKQNLVIYMLAFFTYICWAPFQVSTC